MNKTLIGQWGPKILRTLIQDNRVLKSNSGKKESSVDRSGHDLVGGYDRGQSGRNTDGNQKSGQKGRPEG